MTPKIPKVPLVLAVLFLAYFLSLLATAFMESAARLDLDRMMVHSRYFVSVTGHSWPE